MRVGGKHKDLDEVGRDGRHLTWFEMLGNWSFGDYGKAGAIEFAWEYTTQHLGLDTSKIHISVYKNDDEAWNLWKKIAGLPDSQMVRLGDIDKGDEENFWSMGPVGPCGRCTELYYDQGEELFGHDVVGGATDRYLEFWNLVFMEFNRDDKGVMTPLPMLSVDTGMGMERITALLEGKTNVFATSLFQPVINEVAARVGKKPEGDALIAMQIIADHSRGLTFTLNDNGQFDKQGRGYVLRRILRRAVLHGSRLGFQEPFLHHLVATNMATLPAYIKDSKTAGKIAATIKNEEEKFFETLQRGLAFFEKAVEKAHGGVISGDVAFQLHDTYGFPIDLTRILAEEQNLSVDSVGFDAALEEQRQRSQAASGFYDGGGWVHVRDGHSTGLAGYGLTAMPVQLLEYRLGEENHIDLILTSTPFYVESGGEAADYGTINGNGISITITDVKKTDKGIVHTGRITQGSGAALASATLTAHPDAERRAAKAAHHTATHLLHAALRSVLGDTVRQMGSLVESNRLRFDIAFDRALTIDEVVAVETHVNSAIFAAHTVNHCVGVPFDKAIQMGALAFFGDKYGDVVRVIEIPNVSVELCGGNHVSNTGQIGSFALLSDEALGAGVRRLEAVCHHALVQHFREVRGTLSTLAQKLSVAPAQLEIKIDKLHADLKDARQAYSKALKSGGGSVSTATLLENAIGKDGYRVAVHDMGLTAEEAMTTLIDQTRAKAPDMVIILLGQLDEEKGVVLVGVGDEALAKGVKAGDLAKTIGKALGSGGGGKPSFARAGFKIAEFSSAAAFTQAKALV
jgi:alanyl-tRNA synthetase